MIEELEKEESEKFDLEYYMGVARRRYLHFLIPLFIGWVLVWGASWVLPRSYRSGTLILVEQPTMPKDYVTPNISDDLQERLQSITQQILSRTRLLHIIDEFNLYRNTHAQLTPDDKVQRMRKDIDIELVRDSRNQITAFNVYYSASDPRVAQQVTSELTNLFIDENLEVRQRQSEDTTKFLENQLDAARRVLSEQEETIRQFKAQHAGEMPGQLATNLQILTGLQSQLQNEQDSLNTAKQQRVYLQSLLEQYRIAQGPAKPGDTMALPAIDHELDNLRAQLSDLTSHYTERHPDVRKLKEQITKTERMRSQLMAALKQRAADPASGANDAVSSTQGTDPSQSAMLLQVQSQLRSNQVEIADREHSIATLKEKIDNYQGRLNQEPIREQQLADLTRGYEQSKATYDDLLKKKNESAMATRMELLQQGQRFRIIDPPSFPQKPEFPNRLKFCGMGMLAGILLGLVSAGAFEFMDERIYREEELRELLSTNVLAEIPAIVDHDEQQRTRRTQWFEWCTAALVVGVVLVGSVYSYLRG